MEGNMETIIPEATEENLKEYLEKRLGGWDHRGSPGKLSSQRIFEGDRYKLSFDVGFLKDEIIIRRGWPSSMEAFQVTFQKSIEIFTAFWRLQRRKESESINIDELRQLEGFRESLKRLSGDISDISDRVYGLGRELEDLLDEVKEKMEEKVGKNGND
jgi:hypothetical protein